MTTKSKTAVVVTAPAPLTEAQAQTVTNLVLAGDLSKMDSEARVRYYVQLCESLHLNPLTQPFQILKLSGREVLYATKSCTEQLRKMQGVSVTRLEPRNEGDVYLVVATVQDATGRTDAATGAVPVTNLKGEALANAFMKAETKAKRRATLSICGLGFMDESELDTLPQGQKVTLPTSAEIGTSAMVVAETPAPKKPEAGDSGLASTFPEASTTPGPSAEAEDDRLAELLARMQATTSMKALVELWQGDAKPYRKQLLLAKDRAKARITEAGTQKPGLAITAPAAKTETDAQGFRMVWATGTQKQELIRLFSHPATTRPDKTLGLLQLNKWSQDLADAKIAYFQQCIDEAENTPPRERIARDLGHWVREKVYVRELHAKDGEYLLSLANDEAVSAVALQEEWVKARLGVEAEPEVLPA